MCIYFVHIILTDNEWVTRLRHFTLEASSPFLFPFYFVPNVISSGYTLVKTLGGR